MYSKISHFRPNGSIISNFSRNLKISIIGASGGIGQPLSLFLRLNPIISQLSLYDMQRNIGGIATDLSHIPTNPAKNINRVKAFNDELEIEECIKDSHIVILSAGLSRKPDSEKEKIDGCISFLNTISINNSIKLIVIGMSRDDLFLANANIVKFFAQKYIQFAPQSILLLLTNPLNVMLPLFAEICKKSNNSFPLSRLIGITSLDVIRCKSFISNELNIPANNITQCNVIGGHNGLTILPLLSQVKIKNYSEKLSFEQKQNIYTKVIFAGDEVVRGKAGTGSATLSMAYSTSLFINRLISSFNNNEKIIECCYSYNDIYPCSFFASPCQLGINGVEKMIDYLEYGEIDNFEKDKLDDLIPELNKSIKKGINFAQEI